MTTNNRRFPQNGKTNKVFYFVSHGRDWPGKYEGFNGRLLNSSKVATYETVF
jgi:bisphosphoglycerate-independent phosphoglycerate mutase (AlkP superfamily)